ncbi:hypothetical protein VCR26J2_360003 [Vibrio coralliirubri]|nr:hypothetical protein VCR1J2_410003 [Vibrio coralliirubri]CDT74054.1 hypothetical protein VCR26J2_360003 [Vibrio coralliirubri]CDT97960.1 hypothetical protein VCR8J2_560064 [Vibrio coralliirubri]
MHWVLTKASTGDIKARDERANFALQDKSFAEYAIESNVDLDQSLPR